MKLIFTASLVFSFLLSGCLEPKKTDSQQILEAAQQTVEKLRNREWKQLYLKADPRLKESLTFSEFELYWQPFDIPESVEQVEYGTVETRKGVGNIGLRLLRKDYATVPLTMRFAKSEEQWSLVYITVNQLDYFRSLGMKDPGHLEMQNLVLNLTRRLQLALRLNDYRDFYEQTISTHWRQVTDETSLRESFRSLGHSEFVSLDFEDVRIQLRPSSGVRLDGILHVEGQILTRPAIEFEYQFAWDGNDFRPTGMNLGF